jgi:hypothetical protein
VPRCPVVRSERGQTTVEWLGGTLVLGLLVMAVLAPAFGLDDRLSCLVREQIDKVRSIDQEGSCDDEPKRRLRSLPPTPPGGGGASAPRPSGQSGGGGGTTGAVRADRRTIKEIDARSAAAAKMAVIRGIVERRTSADGVKEVSRGSYDLGRRSRPGRSARRLFRQLTKGLETTTEDGVTKALVPGSRASVSLRGPGKSDTKLWTVQVSKVEGLPSNVKMKFQRSR